MNQQEAERLAENFLAAWNSQDVETVVAAYTEDVVYRDPGTHGEIRGRDDFRRYVQKLFGAWTMRWSLRAAYPFKDEDGAAALWHATLQRADGAGPIEVDGMDLVQVRDGCIARNEVYFDRLALAPLLPQASARA
jgi:steroid delta-isomerase-like uncharacterized protein